VAAAIGELGWALLEVLGVDRTVIACLIGPFLLAVPLLFLAGKLAVARQDLRR